MIKNKKIILKITIITIMIISLGQISYARYIQTETLKGRQQISKPILNLKEGMPIKIDAENKTGNYEFSIENFIEDDISETGFYYTIEISLNMDLKYLEYIKMNLNFKLYDDEKEIKLINLKTEPILINGNRKIEQKYRLNIEYDEINLGNNEENDFNEIVEKISGEIHIKVDAYQEII